eukprot:s2523_g2.t1
MSLREDFVEILLKSSPRDPRIKILKMLCRGQTSVSTFKIDSNVTMKAGTTLGCRLWCSFAPQNISSAAKRAGFNRAMPAVAITTGAVLGKLLRRRKTSVFPLKVDSSVTMKAADFGSLLAELGLDVLRARLECRHFSEVPRVCQSCMLPIPPKVILFCSKKQASIPSPCQNMLMTPSTRSEPPTILYPLGLPLAGSKEVMAKGNRRQSFSEKQVRNLSEFSWKNSSMTLSASRCSFALQNISSAAQRADFNRAMPAVTITSGAVSGRLTSGSALGLDSNVTMKADSPLLAERGLDVLMARHERRHFSEAMPAVTITSGAVSGAVSLAVGRL